MIENEIARPELFLRAMARSTREEDLFFREMRRECNDLVDLVPTGDNWL